MDLPLILRATLSLNSEERRAAEQNLEQIQFEPLHLPKLLQIIVDKIYDMEVRLVASIIFKNIIAKYWTPDEPNEPQKISMIDKNLLREFILPLVSRVPLLLRVQLGESLKTIIHSDHPEQWPNLLGWMESNIQGQYVYGASFVLWILLKRYVSNDERSPGTRLIQETFPHLLNRFRSHVKIVNPSLEVSDLIKLICKIFWLSTYLEVPMQLFNKYVFDSWMNLFLILLARRVPLEGQPMDLELRKSWGWLKVKKWIVRIVNRLYSRSGELNIPEYRSFAKMFQTYYAAEILECLLSALIEIPAGDYLPDRVTNLILQYLTDSISRNSMFSVLKPRLSVLFEKIFPLMCFNDNDQNLWDEDPQEYVRRGSDILEDKYSPRTASLDFVSTLVRERGKEDLKFVLFIVGIFNRYYDVAAVEYRDHRQKDGALLATGVLSDKLIGTEPYKSELERMLVRNVYSEFNSPIGHLRAKAAWVSGQYAYINFADPNNFRRALRFVVSGLHDSQLPVRVDSAIALRSFVEACRDRDEIRPFFPQLLDDTFNLMNEVENEDLFFTLDMIFIKFGDEMAPYAPRLCQKLAASILSGDPDTLPAIGCLQTISSILKSVSRLPNLLVQIVSILLPIMRTMLAAGCWEAYKLEEVFEIVSLMTLYSPTISLDMWSLWPLMVEKSPSRAIAFFRDLLAPLGNFISKGTTHFLTCKQPDYQLSLWKLISSIMADKISEDGDAEPAPKLIQLVFQNCRGQVNNWIKPCLRITVNRLRRAEKARLKCLLMQVIADAFYYDASLTLDILHKLGVDTEVFNIWLQMLKRVKMNGLMANFVKERGKKVCCLGLTSLLPLLLTESELLVRVFKANLDLLVAYKNQVTEATKKEAKNGDNDKDGIQTGDDEADKVRQQELHVVPSLHGHAIDENDNELYDYASSDEEFQSPIDEVDPFVFFMRTVTGMQKKDPTRFKKLIQTLDVQYKERAISIYQHAVQRRRDIEKEKAEKASSKRLCD